MASSIKAVLLEVKLKTCHDGRVIRIGDSSKRKAMERFILYFDGLATVMGIMDLMTREDKGLAHLVEDLPKIHMSIRDIECPW